MPQIAGSFPLRGAQFVSGADTMAMVHNDPRIARSRSIGTDRMAGRALCIQPTCRFAKHCRPCDQSTFGFGPMTQISIPEESLRQERFLNPWEERKDALYPLVNAAPSHVAPDGIIGQEEPTCLRIPQLWRLRKGIKGNSAGPVSVYNLAKCRT